MPELTSAAMPTASTMLARRSRPPISADGSYMRRSASTTMTRTGNAKTKKSFSASGVSSRASSSAIVEQDQVGHGAGDREAGRPRSASA